MNGKQLPNLYIAGAQKCGTTSLFDWLAHHPEIFGPIEAKDYPFFSDPTAFTTQATRFEKMFGNGVRMKFRLGAEANILYSPGAVERLHSTIPNALIIVIMRNPVTRAISAWRFAKERYLDERDFMEAIQDELAGRVFAEHSYKGMQMNYLLHSTYSPNLRKLQQLFSPDRLIYLIYEEFFQEPSVAFAKLLQQLGLDDTFVAPLANSNQTASSSRSRIISKLLFHPDSRGMLIKTIVSLASPKTRAYIRRALRSLNRSRKASTEDVQTVDTPLLNTHFAQEIENVEKLIGRELGIWKYAS